ncbi:MAG: TetR family transcriptional regulator [Hyphomicrobiales bacterium]|nr:TetR family transcriptional regulator [Hyphomicrobiales bacterium]
MNAAAAQGGPRSQAARQRIRIAARDLFGTLGYERTTIRAVASVAEIHPSMVMRYFGSKEGLFAAAANFDLQLPEIATVPRDEVGRALVRHFLWRWENDNGELPALLRVAITHEQARARMTQIVREQIAPMVVSICGSERAPVCIGLLATQMLGLAFSRYVLRLEPVVALPDGIIIDRLGANLQSILFDPG